MTQEGHDARPEDAPPPPTSTRWSSPEVEEDVGLIPPYVPGRREPDAEPGPVLDTNEAVVDTGDAVREASEPAVEAVDTEAVETPADEEPFPFEIPLEGETTPSRDDLGEQPGEGTATMELDELEAPPDVGQEGPEGPERPEGPAAAEPAEITEPAPSDDWSGRAESAGFEAEGDPAVAEIADRLEALAGRIRAEGRSAAEREMSSTDRFTSLVAGLVAGFLAGIRDQ